MTSVPTPTYLGDMLARSFGHDGGSFAQYVDVPLGFTHVMDVSEINSDGTNTIWQLNHMAIDVSGATPTASQGTYNHIVTSPANWSDVNLVAQVSDDIAVFGVQERQYAYPGTVYSQKLYTFRGNADGSMTLLDSYDFLANFPDISSIDDSRVDLSVLRFSYYRNCVYGYNFEIPVNPLSGIFGNVSFWENGRGVFGTIFVPLSASSYAFVQWPDESPGGNSGSGIYYPDTDTNVYVPSDLYDDSGNEMQSAVAADPNTFIASGPSYNELLWKVTYDGTDFIAEQLPIPFMAPPSGWTTSSPDPSGRYSFPNPTGVSVQLDWTQWFLDVNTPPTGVAGISGYEFEGVTSADTSLVGPGFADQWHVPVSMIPTATGYVLVTYEDFSETFWAWTLPIVPPVAELNLARARFTKSR